MNPILQHLNCYFTGWSHSRYARLAGCLRWFFSELMEGTYRCSLLVWRPKPSLEGTSCPRFYPTVQWWYQVGYLQRHNARKLEPCSSPQRHCHDQLAIWCRCFKWVTQIAKIKYSLVKIDKKCVHLTENLVRQNSTSFFKLSSVWN